MSWEITKFLLNKLTTKKPYNIIKKNYKENFKKCYSKNVEQEKYLN